MSSTEMQTIDVVVVDMFQTHRSLTSFDITGEFGAHGTISARRFFEFYSYWLSGDHKKLGWQTRIELA